MEGYVPFYPFACAVGWSTGSFTVNASGPENRVKRKGGNGREKLYRQSRKKVGREKFANRLLKPPKIR